MAWLDPNTRSNSSNHVVYYGWLKRQNATSRPGPSRVGWVGFVLRKSSYPKRHD